MQEGQNVKKGCAAEVFCKNIKNHKETGCHRCSGEDQ